MKNLRIYLILLSCIVTNFKTHAQSTFMTNTHPGVGTPFLGWDNTVNSNANNTTLEHQGTQNINFLTNGTQRMTILGTASGSPGNVGIGIAMPTNLVTITDNGTTGFGAVLQSPELLVVGGDNAQPSTNQIIAEFRSREQSTSSAGIKIRGSRNVAVASNSAFINFSNWYDGTSDAEFLLARITADQTSFTILPFPDFEGYMRFFTTDQFGSNFNAMLDANGYFGIGYNFFRHDQIAAQEVLPNRRLESYDANDPQLRLSRVYDITNTEGTFTDFETILDVDNIAKLYIHPSSDAVSAGTPVDGFVGINDASPSNTLEITSNANSPKPAGLRFTNLTSASSPDVGSFSRFLTVNASGDVVLDDVPGGISICNSPGLTTANLITKVTATNEICQSDIWENSSPDHNVGIGTYGPQYKFHVLGESVFSDALFPAFPYYNSCTKFSAAVRTLTNTGCPDDFGGLAILSAETPSASLKIDRLHLYSDNNGFNHIVTHGTNTVYRDIQFPNSLLGFLPGVATTVVKADFESNPTAHSNCTFYVEAQYSHGTSPEVEQVAIYAENNMDDQLIGVGGLEFYGVVGSSMFRKQVGSSITNTGGWFMAAGGDDVNQGLKAEVVEPSQASWNVGVSTWVSPDAFGTNPSTSTGTVPNNLGLLSRVFYTNTNAVNYGGYFDVRSGRSNYGIASIANNNAPNNFGGYFEAQNGTTVNYGVNALALPNAGGTGFNVAVFGRAPVNPPFPIPNPAPAPGTGTWAGYFNGDLGYTGSFGLVSDSIVKTDIVALSDSSANSILSQLTTYSYFYDTAQFDGYVNFSKNLQFGFMAQELEVVAPNLVINSSLPPEIDSLGNIINAGLPVKMINYIGLIPLLVKGYNELKAENDSIMQIVNGCCGVIPSQDGGFKSIQQGSIELENIKTMQLEQNDPNPFDASTMIRWSINTDFTNAVVYFYDNAGNRINSYKITEKGNGELQVFGSKLTSGIYTYTLVVDGKIVDSKKMMRAK